MTRAESYRILELPVGSSEQEIKRQFKRLALKVHPDINPDPKANDQFIRLTKAVETLLKPNPKSAKTRTSKSEAGKRNPAQSESEDEKIERMSQAQMRFNEQRLKREMDDNRYYQSLTVGKKWNVYQWIVRIGCVISITLCLDGFLPHHYIPDQINSFSNSEHNGVLFNRISEIELKSGGNQFAQINRSSWMGSYPDLYIESTWFFHTPIQLIQTDDFERFTTGIDFHIGAIRWYLVAVFLFPLYPYFNRRKKLSFVVWYQFSFWGIGLMEAYVLLTHDRLMHLLTFGFV